MDGSLDSEDTFLTERQAEVLALREGGSTQREIADRIGTTTANVSAVESSARENVAKARRTLSLATLLHTTVRFSASVGTDLREIVDRTFDVGDEAGVRIAYSDPELTAHLRARLEGRLADRRLTEDVELGITPEGDVVTHPTARFDRTRSTER